MNMVAFSLMARKRRRSVSTADSRKLTTSPRPLGSDGRA